MPCLYFCLDIACVCCGFGSLFCGFCVLIRNGLTFGLKFGVLVFENLGFEVLFEYSWCSWLCICICMCIIVRVLSFDLDFVFEMMKRLFVAFGFSGV